MLEEKRGPSSRWDSGVIHPRTDPDTRSVARHYDELDPFYRALWGEHLHHGFWRTGRESARTAAVALVEEVARRADIRGGSRVCDVGCGYGAPARLLAAGGARVTALTVSPAQFRHAQLRNAHLHQAEFRHAGHRQAEHRRGRLRHAPGVHDEWVHDRGLGPRFLLRDWLRNGLESQVFDAVIAIESLAHMPDKGAALAEAFRVLRPGGRLVACLWLSAPDPAPWQVRHLLRPICEQGRLAGLPEAGEYRRWAEAAGFREVAMEDVTDRVARTWAVSARRVALAVVRPASLRYLADRRNSERGFALSVLRLLLAYRTGAMRYGILSASRPPSSPAR